MRDRLPLVLAAAFLLATFMGAGPGLHLLDPEAAFLGMPVVYAWGVGWFLVEVAVLGIAFRLLWRDAG